MKLSSKTVYGIRGLFDIAFNEYGGPAQLGKVAERAGIPPRYLEQIFQRFRKAGILTSKTGPNGGYRLNREPEEITLADILAVTEGATQFKSSTRLENGDDIVESVVEDIWQSVSDRFAELAATHTLQDVMDRAINAGAIRPTRTDLMYYI